MLIMTTTKDNNIKATSVCCAVLNESKTRVRSASILYVSQKNDSKYNYLLEFCVIALQIQNNYIFSNTQQNKLWANQTK